MLGGVLLGLLEAGLLFLLVLDLPALLEFVVGRSVVGTLPDQQPERPEEHPTQGGCLLEQSRVGHRGHHRVLAPPADHCGVQQGEAHVRGHDPQASSRPLGGSGMIGQ